MQLCVVKQAQATVGEDVAAFIHVEVSDVVARVTQDLHALEKGRDEIEPLLVA